MPFFILTDEKEQTVNATRAFTKAPYFSHDSVGPVSAAGKRVGPVIEKFLARNPDWTVTIF
jgi:hypothetical protein